jgi:hypothetical protein
VSSVSLYDGGQVIQNNNSSIENYLREPDISPVPVGLHKATHMRQFGDFLKESAALKTRWRREGDLNSQAPSDAEGDRLAMLSNYPGRCAGILDRLLPGARRYPMA